MTERVWRVPEQAAGERLDRHVAGRLEAPRNQVARWIEGGRVRIDGEVAPRASVRVRSGQEICCLPLPIDQEGRVEPEEGELRIVYQDEAMVVLDKPAGVTVHPGAGRPDGTLANVLLARYPEMAEVGGPGRPGIVHRLDHGTSGILVTARTPLAYRELSAAFAHRRVVKRYLAIVFGRPDPPTARIEAPIARHATERKRMTIGSQGRPATTSYRTLASSGAVSLLELDLATGRTHQIRVHCKAIHHPLIGDPVYGEARWKELPVQAAAAARDFPRPALHAWRIELPHPTTGSPWRAEAPLDPPLSELWVQLTGTALPELPEDWDWVRPELPELRPRPRGYR